MKDALLKGCAMAKWICTTDQLPPRGVRVLVMVGGDAPRLEVSAYSFEGWVGIDDADVTHWAELPPFPTVEPSDVLPIPRQQYLALFNHLAIKFDEGYADFCAWSMAYDIAAYGDGFKQGNSTYADYQSIEGDAHKAYWLYRLCRGSETLEHYAPYCWSLSCDLKAIARNTYQAIPKKKRAGAATRGGLAKRTDKTNLCALSEAGTWA